MPNARARGMLRSRLLKPMNREVEAQIELDLPVIWLHVLTELIEGFVVLLFPEVRELVDNDHA